MPKQSTENKLAINPPHLLFLQVNSYQDFLQNGLNRAFALVFPIKVKDSPDKKAALEFVSCKLIEPRNSFLECIERGFTYEAMLKGVFRLIIKGEHDEIKEAREQELNIISIPFMTETGSFVTNGVERVVLGHIQRSPGIYFHKGKAVIIPRYGPHITITADNKKGLAMVFDKGPKIPLVMFLAALGCEPDNIARSIYKGIGYSFDGGKVSKKKETGKGDAYITASAEELSGMMPFEPIISPKTGKIILDRYESISEEKIEEFKKGGVDSISCFKDDFLIIKNLKRLDIKEAHAYLEKKPDLKITPLALAGRIFISRILIKGKPPSTEKENQYFEKIFFVNYSMGEAGRFNLNHKLGLNPSPPLTCATIRPEDLIAVVLKLLDPEFLDKIKVDDYDNLGNRRIRFVGEILEEVFLKGLRASIRQSITAVDENKLNKLMPRDILDFSPLYREAHSFFSTNPLSQLLAQTNPLSEISHKRRLSAGKVGRNASISMRDVHYDHFGRLCPIESPEGQNIGIVVNLALYARPNRFGFLETPFFEVKNGRVTDKLTYISSVEEIEHVIVPVDTPVDFSNIIIPEELDARAKGDVKRVKREDVSLMGVSPFQIFGACASLVPFIEHSDGHRALMGSNMQKQAVPLLKPEPPFVGTGMEDFIANESGAVIKALRDGIVEYVDAGSITVRHKDGSGRDIYHLNKYHISNAGTCIHQSPIVKEGDSVYQGDILTSGPAITDGRLSLGRNVLVAFMPWRGYNFEDSIIISERLVKEDIFTSIHMEEFSLSEAATKAGREEITADIPGVELKQLQKLGSDGIIKIGAVVNAGDILVGKVSPIELSEEEMTPEGLLMRAIAGLGHKKVMDTSLVVPHGIEGTVVRVDIYDEHGNPLKRGVENNVQAAFVVRKRDNVIVRLDQNIPCNEREDKEGEIPLRTVKVFIAVKRKLSVGDKMAGRYGNKGVVSIIVPEEDMPYLPDGTSVDVVLNPLGIPSRMNIGQLLEVHLGWAAMTLGKKLAEAFLKKEAQEIKNILKCFYEGELDSLAQEEILALGEKYQNKVCFKIPPFTGIGEKEITEFMKIAGLPETGKTILYDGRTGEQFDSEVTVGVMYMMKLDHLVDNKIHARAKGPYSLKTQQPLEGRGKFGGQRIGEMEVWAIEAYGAALNLQEMMTVKSDDMDGREEVVEEIFRNGYYSLNAGTPEAYKVLCMELKGLGLRLETIKDV